MTDEKRKAGIATHDLKRKRRVSFEEENRTSTFVKIDQITDSSRDAQSEEEAIAARRAARAELRRQLVPTAPVPNVSIGSDEPGVAITPIDPIDDDEDDMFADPRPVQSTNLNIPVSTLDNSADEEGYYRILVGEILDARYSVTSFLGKGVFSAVVRAHDSTTSEDVAIKLIRNNALMSKAATHEIAVLEKVASPYIITLRRTFEHAGHVCLVFENMDANLRQIIRKYGRDRGLNITAIKAYSAQLFAGLAYLHAQGYVHGDLKPDNILISKSRTKLRIGDLGSSFESPSEGNPYLASRFYRSPESILSLPNTSKVDIWAAGCTLFELLTARILFPGVDNADMLRVQQVRMGRIPNKLTRGSKYFPDGVFEFNAQPLDIPQLGDLRKQLGEFSKEDRVLMSKFADLLSRSLDLDPGRRISAREAQSHAFHR